MDSLPPDLWRHQWDRPAIVELAKPALIGIGEKRLIGFDKPELIAATVPGISGLAGFAGSGGTLVNVVSLLRNNTSSTTVFTDETGKGWSKAGTVISGSTTRTKFNGSLDFTNGGSLASAAHADWAFGSGEFTINFWFNWNGGGSNFAPQGIVCHDNLSGTRGWIVWLDTNNATPANRINMQAWVGGTDYTIAGTASPNTNQWYNIEFTRDKSGGTDKLRYYRDGVQIGSIDITGTMNDPNTMPAMYGALCDGGTAALFTNVNCYLDEMIIIKGTCLHPGGTTWTPMSAEWTYPLYV